MKQYEAVIETMKKLGGIASLGQLNQEVFKIEDCEWKTKSPFASIRRIVQTNANIYKIKPGLYGLTAYKNLLERNGIIIETDKNRDSNEFKEFTHAYFQGLLLSVGNLKKMKTFAPNQDKNRKFASQTLGELRTLSEIPQYSYAYFVHKSSSVDVVWFNENHGLLMPHTFFEVEHSTDIQNSLLKFNELRDFYARMIIVADSKRKEEYLNKIRYSSFYDLRNPVIRVSFLDYEALNKQYERELEKQSFEILL